MNLNNEYNSHIVLLITPHIKTKTDTIVTPGTRPIIARFVKLLMIYLSYKHYLLILSYLHFQNPRALT